MSPAARARLERLGPWLILAAVTITSLVLVLHHGRSLTFYYDEWNFVMNRGGSGFDVFLRPHNEHASLFPVALYKTLFAVFGLGHYWVYLGAHALICELVAIAVYVYARRRIGPWWALVPAVAMALVASAPDYILQTFELTFGLSLLAGVLALLCLDRGTQRAALGATALLVVAVFSSGVGLPVLAVCALDVLLRPTRRQRWWVVAVPAALYAVWWLGYQPESDLALKNVIHVPRFAEEMFVAGVRALTTLGSLAPVAAAVLAVAVVRIGVTGGAARTRLWAIVGGALLFWTLTTLVRYGTTPPDNPRYMYPTAALMALVCVELAATFLPRAVSRVALAVTVFLIGALYLNNVGLLQAERSNIKDSSRVAAVELAALQLAGRGTDPGYRPDTGLMPDVTAGGYFAAQDRWGGSAAASLEDVAAASPDARAEADRVLREAGRVAVSPFTGTSQRCRTITPPADPLVLAPGQTVVLRAPQTGGLSVAARRFGDSAASVGTVAAGTAGSLTVPKDAAVKSPWTVELTADAAFELCGA